MFGLVKSLVKGLQNPGFEVVESAKTYEVRSYAAAKWVSTTVKSTSHKDARSQGFRKLFKYIQGENEGNKTVEMTAPVVTHVNSEGESPEKSFTVSFYIPQEHQEEPPKPSDPDICIEEKPARTVYVWTFGGFGDDQKWADEGKALTEAIGDESKYHKDFYFTAGYDPPFKLLGRTNEIWFVKKDT